MRTERGGRKGRRAHSARYCRVYAKLVQRGRKQKDSYLRPLVASKRRSSRRGTPMWVPWGWAATQGIGVNLRRFHHLNCASGSLPTLWGKIRKGGSGRLQHCRTPPH